MDIANSAEMAQPADEIPGLNLDFSNFDLSQFVSADAGAAPAPDMHMHPMSGPHSTHTSPMLNPVQDHSQGHRAAQMATNSEIARLQYSLDQQRRMNELNQLQNRILQQQLEIMGCTPPTHLPVGYPGLMTPVSSTELRPMAYDSNALTSALGNNVDLYQSLLSPAMTPHMASSTSHPSPFPQTHGTPHFLSPLTSPALTPSPSPFDSFRQAPMSAVPSPAQMSFPPLPSPSFGPSGTNSRPKRGATTDVDSARKRASPIVKPTPSSKMGIKRTPRMRPRGESIAQSRASPLPSPRPSTSIDPTGDAPISTPSPVDLSTATFSMPPPVVPISRTSPSQELDTVMEHVQSADGTPVVSASANPSLPPVAAATPASLMNLGRLATQPTGLKHGDRTTKESVESQDSTDSSQSAAASPPKATISKRDKTKEAEQVKATAKGKASVAKSNSSVRQSPAILPAISPAIKPNMPSSFTAEAIAHLSTKSNYQNTLEGRAAALGITSSSGGSSYPPDGRKTSHKAAEQKRRDSLKAGFDDLRLLLPPIALSACAELDPGAAPPRGPPRNVPGGEDNPNRAVSKLALLRFSNEWIVKLGRRVERRDQAIEDLKKEIQMLREMLGPDTDVPDGFNLDANLDKIEEESEEGKSIRVASRPTEKIKAQKPEGIAEQEEEDGDEAD